MQDSDAAFALINIILIGLTVLIIVLVYLALWSAREAEKGKAKKPDYKITEKTER